ncbi:MAG: hypothetical protein EBY23_11085 [Actinobacteria bacterium]|nr:hypothetical protein [Actinomycetota bacterium]
MRELVLQQPLHRVLTVMRELVLQQPLHRVLAVLRELVLQQPLHRVLAVMRELVVRHNCFPNHHLLLCLLRFRLYLVHITVH